MEMFKGLGNIFKSQDEITNDKYVALENKYAPIFGHNAPNADSNYARELDLLNNETAAAYAPDNKTAGIGNDTWGTIGSIGQLGLGGLNALTGMKQMKLAKDAFNFNVMDKNRTYAMAKDAYDKNVARAASIGSQMNKGKVE